MKNPDEIICWCQKVSSRTIVTALKNGATTLADIASATGAGNGGRCKDLNPNGTCSHPDILVIIAEVSIQNGTAQ